MGKGWDRDSAIWIGRRFNKFTSVGRSLRGVASTFRQGRWDRTVRRSQQLEICGRQTNRGDAFGLGAAGLMSESSSRTMSVASITFFRVFLSMSALSSQRSVCQHSLRYLADMGGE